MSAAVAHHFADLGDVRLHYVTAGSGFPIVLLHGWPQSWYEWRHVIPALAERYRVIAPDDPLVAASDTLPPTVVVPPEKDLEYYDHLIRGDEAWFASVRRQAFWKGESADAAVRRNAEWMIEQDQLQAR